MNKTVISILLVGGRGTRLEQLTTNTAKPAVSFGAKYRLIDFALSNLTNSNIDTVGVITQYEPYELMKYIGTGATWDLDVNYGGVSFLTPYLSQGAFHFQSGTANAIKQHLRFIELYNPEFVLILSGDHIYKMNYEEMIETHKRDQNDITIASFRPSNHLERYGILEADENGKITSFEEKPKQPKSTDASMGIYIFNRTVLNDLLSEENEQMDDFGHDVIPLALKKELKLGIHRFNGYFKDVGTIQALFEANMELIDEPKLLNLKDYHHLPVYSVSSNLPPHHIAEMADVKESLIADGTLILGRIKHSVIGSGVFVDQDTIINNSIINSNVKVGKSCVLENCIVVHDLIISDGVILRYEEPTIVTSYEVNRHE
jgi:glucose-1-phosphate adenylyltransferase